MAWVAISKRSRHPDWSGPAQGPESSTRNDSSSEFITVTHLLTQIYSIVICVMIKMKTTIVPWGPTSFQAQRYKKSLLFTAFTEKADTKQVM